MKESFWEFNELISKAGVYLSAKLGYAPRSVDEYKKDWKRIRKFMVSGGIEYYNRNVEKQVFYSAFEDRSIRKLSTHEKHFYNAGKMLSEFQETGKINVPAPPCKDPIIFSGPIGLIMASLIEHKRIDERLSPSGIHYYQRYLFQFLSYCNENNFQSIEDINLSIIILYLRGWSSDTSSTMTLRISTLRGFLKYAFEQKFLLVDYSSKIPKYKSVTQPKLPSTYSTQEIEKLIQSVERNGSIGKRDYAIILIAARLGLRASDISRLKFENLDWNTNTIKINQYKTGKELTLPLLTDLGNALIDYLKYGRPKSEEGYVFLTEKPPYGRFTTSNVVTHVVQRAFKKAGIDINGKRFGPHSLRHSLGSRMLEQSTILPVISEVLGHKNSGSTMYYLRIDLKSMEQCILDVPEVASKFYEQQGGAFYE